MNYRNVFLFVVFTIHVFQYSIAQKSVNTVFHSESPLCKKCIKIWDVKPSQCNIDSLSIAYKKCLKNKGYIAATIDSIKKDKDTVHLFLYNGIRYKWDSIIIMDAPIQLLSVSAYKINKLYRKHVDYSKYEEIREKIINKYENSGYPFVSIKTDSVNIDSFFLSLTSSVLSGEYFVFDSLEVTGTKKVSPLYVSHYLEILPDKFYNEKKVKTIPKKLKELSFISEAKPTEVYFIENKAHVRLFLKNTKSNQFNGILGLLPDNNDPGKYVLTGDVSLNLINSFKHGDIIEFSWKKLESSSQNLNIQVQWPYLLNKPIGMAGFLKLFKKDSTYINVTSRFGIPFYLSGSNTLGVYYENSSSTLLLNTDYSSITVLPTISGYKTNMYGLSFNFSNLDYKYNPSKGLLIKLQAGYGQKIIEKLPDANPLLYKDISLTSFRNEFLTDVAGFLPIYKKLVIKFRGQLGYINTKNLLQNELYRIGGLSTLRGFDEESIYASVYGIGTSEFRFLFEKNSAVFTFFDKASYQNIKGKVDNPYGFGVGIEFQTGAGIFSLTYALGRQFNNPIEVKNARIHFGFINRF